MISLKLSFLDQVRRIQIAEESGSNGGFSYSTLETAALKLFEPKLSGKKILFRYHDDEDDVVTFSSDQELAEALRVMTSIGLPVLRFEVVVDGEGTRPVHYYVTCDGCGMSPIVGDRFKCTVLHDFDLCDACEGKKEHPHPLRKIVEPVDYRRRCMRLRQQARGANRCGDDGDGAGSGGIAGGKGRGGCGGPHRKGWGGRGGGGGKWGRCGGRPASAAVPPFPLPFVDLAKDILESIGTAAATDGENTTDGVGNVAEVVKNAAAAFGFDGDSAQVKQWMNFAEQCSQAGIIAEVLGQDGCRAAGAADKDGSSTQAYGAVAAATTSAADAEPSATVSSEATASSGSPIAGSYGPVTVEDVEDGTEVDQACADDYVFASTTPVPSPATATEAAGADGVANAGMNAPMSAPIVDAVTPSVPDSIGSPASPMDPLDQWRAELQMLSEMGFTDVATLIPLLKKHVPAGVQSRNGDGDHEVSQIGIQRVVQAYLGM